ncbi:MAG: chemotaxis response regulator protein-glutamate methylesterase [endosymbiont of Escarpia spicata]|uniref:Protein-glutamate methylesterase/protein-glutamine glutaminase n=1 Tax=endosymbiont of Escarpia spicata TaxID=2200908 RepID=A0A370DBB6_9GAMM|nr:MAG: chemotaxis response regulator protein-glutamate methylesterase [endosymbiont of Escarpia spicata]
MIKVLVVDDSALVRQLLTSILSDDPGIEVVGSAADPFVARDKIKKLNPDVLTLDVEMPRMDGVTFLGNLMRLRPMPVVMVSTLTEQGADVTLRALEAGAVDFVSKPKLDVAHELPEYSEEIVGKVKTAAKARVRALERRPAKKTKVTEKLSADAVLSKPVMKKHFRTTDRIIGIGSSTGGTEAIKDVVRDLPPDMPGIVISQHIPEAFSGAFAQRVNSITALTVLEASDGQQVLPGHVYIAPGNRHLIIQRDGARYICKLNDGPPVNRHKPSVDVMFRSLSQNAGANAIAVMLTGMGDDGAAGMGEMKQAGSPTIAQDERTSVVWGMPGEAVKRGFVEEILSLNKIGKRLQELSSE